MTEKCTTRNAMSRARAEIVCGCDRTFQNDPKLAENMCASRCSKTISSDDYQDAMSNASFTYDVSLSMCRSPPT